MAAPRPDPRASRAEPAPAPARAPGDLLLTFTIPTVPRRLNLLLRCHWSARRRERDRLRDYVRLFTPLRTPVPIPAAVTLRFYTEHGRGDPDAFAKPLLDALQGIVLVTDSPRWIRSLTQSVHRGTPRTEIEIRRARPEP